MPIKEFKISEIYLITSLSLPIETELQANSLHQKIVENKK
jgi:hypothetical protein